jgi:ureidoglycolate lyase
MARELVAAALTPEAMAPFGEVVSAGLGAGASANQGTAVRFDWTSHLESTRPGARPNLAVFRSVARSLPIEITLLEKHPCSSQTFLPLLCARYLVCVAPALQDGTPDLDRMVALVGRAGQGVSYHRDVWHHPIVALDQPAELAMLAWEDGGPLDCVEHALPEPVRVLGG